MLLAKRRYRVEKFSDLNGLLGRVRLNEAPDFHHEMVRVADENGLGKKCVLCSYGDKKRTSMFWCRICEATLCVSMIAPTSRKSCNHQWHSSTNLKREASNRNTQVEALQVVKRSVTKGKKRRSSEREDTTYALVYDENASPLAGSIPQVNDENASPLAENVPPRRVPENVTLMRRSTRRARGVLLQSELSPLAENIPPRRGVPEIIALVRRSTRRATAALHDGELTSFLEIQGAAILSSVRTQRSSVREMEDL
jgi:hypothetical protein